MLKIFSNEGFIRNKMSLVYLTCHAPTTLFGICRENHLLKYKTLCTVSNSKLMM